MGKFAPSLCDSATWTLGQRRGPTLLAAASPVLAPPPCDRGDMAQDTVGGAWLKVKLFVAMMYVSRETGTNKG